MGVSSSQLQPHELISFKKLPSNVPLENIEIPERPENRTRTNVKWLIVLGVFILLLFPFLIYTLVNSDIQRLLSGYDKCGNVCGKNNSYYSNAPCSGQDKTLYPYLEFEEYQDGNVEVDWEFTDRHCVAKCRTGFISIMGRCIKSRTRQSEFSLDSYPGHGVSKEKYDRVDSVDLGEYFNNVKWQIIISCLISVLVAIGMLFLFRYAVAFVVWGIMIGSFTTLVILVVALWYVYTIAEQEAKQSLMVFCIAITIVAAVLGIVLIWFRKKIGLVILLLKETTKAVFRMPALITLPVFCLFGILILTFLFVLTSLYMFSAGTLELAFSDYYVYVQNPVMLFTMGYNFVIYLWLTQFVTGLQYMVVAGAVSKWYFTREKSYLDSPILTSLSTAVKYHLGTVALGSLIITIVQVIKALILSLIKNDKLRAFVESCADAIETFFKFLSKNAYIVTAMHGQAFIRSGKRAAKLIIQNIGDIIAVNYIGDFVLGMAKILIVIVSLLISMGIFAIAPNNFNESNLWSYIIVGVVSLVIACVAFGVFETTIDTIFICYCEDNLLNDGMARPYFMSRNLMEFIQTSKDLYGKK